MAEHLLNAAQVGPALDEVRREAVAEGVRAGPALEAGALERAAQDEIEALPGERRAARVQEQLVAPPAAAANDPSGTTRSLSPLPRQRSRPPSRSTSA